MLCNVTGTYGRQFTIPTIHENQWREINQDLSSLLAPVHFDLCNGLINPKQAGDTFSEVLTEFLKSVPEISNKQSDRYISHEPKTLSAARKKKNALRKKAFSRNATAEDRKAFNDAIKSVSHLKHLEEKKREGKSASFQEKQSKDNFWSFAKKAAEGNLSTNPARPSFSAEYANRYYPQKYSSSTPLDVTKLNWFPFIPTDRPTPFDLSPVLPKHLRSLLKKKKPQSAPGDDGILYGLLRRLPSTHHFLATLFSKQLHFGDPPETWSHCRISLIHKGGDTNDPSNFRMISLTSCVSKLFHQILADRTIEYLIANKLIDNETQKAFLPGISGCIDHTLCLREIIAHARHVKRTAHITFFDLADAFGSVNHEMMLHTLERNGIPPPIVNYVTNLYSRLSGYVQGPDWRSDKFRFARGTFQENCKPPS